MIALLLQITEGEDIYDFLCGKLIDYELFVIFVLSEAYYNKPGALKRINVANKCNKSEIESLFYAR